MFLLYLILWCSVMMEVQMQPFEGEAWRDCKELHLYGSVFTSPNFPDDYTNDFYCEYHGIAADGYRIVLLFSSFDVEYESACAFDSVTVYDGEYPYDPILGTFCGSVIPRPIFSEGPRIMFTFSTDGSVTGSGFQARFIEVQNHGHCTNYTIESGSNFTSPNYPSNYNNLDKCEYRATAPPGHYVTVTFVSFNLQYSLDCLKDVVEIYDGNSSESQVIATLCGSIQKQTFFSSGNEMLIILTTDLNITSSGFEGFFFFHEYNCSQTILENGTILTSPNFPHEYGNFRKCDYNVEAPHFAFSIILTFLAFDVEYDESCLKDSVAIYDTGKIGTEKLLAKVCGSQIPDTLKLNSSALRITFTSDDALAKSGFILLVNFVEDICQSCNTSDYYYGECPENSTPPSADQQLELDKLPPAYLLQCRTLTSGSFQGEHYWMVSDCPEDADDFLRNKCVYDGEEGDTRLYLPPVESLTLMVVFKNAFCALCNGLEEVDFAELSVNSRCLQCPEGYKLREGDVLEDGAHNCTVTSESVSLRRCFPIEPVRFGCPIRIQQTDPGLAAIFFDAPLKVNLQPVCLEDQIAYNDICVDVIVQEHCLHTRRYHIVILNVDWEKYRCSYLIQRSKVCFLNKLQEYEEKQLHAIPDTAPSQTSEHMASSQLKSFELPWNELDHPSWMNTSQRHHLLLNVPTSVPLKINWKQHLMKAIEYIFIDDEGYQPKGCYLESIDLLEICGASSLQCQGGIYEAEYNITKILQTSSEQSFIIDDEDVENLHWFGVRSIFNTSGRESEKTLVACEVHESLTSNRDDFIRSIWNDLCSGIALVCLLITFLIYATTKSRGNTFGVVVMVFIASLAMVIGLLQFISPHASDIAWLCSPLAIFVHWLWISVFCWMGILAFDLRSIFNMRNMKIYHGVNTRRLSIYVAFGWGMPTLVVSASVTIWIYEPTLLVYGVDEQRMCWISGRAAVVVLSGPLLLCLTSNFILFVLMVKGLCGHKENSKRAHAHSQQTGGSLPELIVTIKISVLMGFTWLSGYIAPLTGNDNFNYVFYVLILVQGVLILVFFGANKRTRKACGTTLRLRKLSCTSNPTSNRSEIELQPTKKDDQQITQAELNV